jgi:major vault protein
LSLIALAITVSENEAIYIRNTLTSELKLVKGPISYLPNVDEERFMKKLSKEEYQALGIPAEPSFKAYVVQIQKNECLCVIDYKDNKEEYIMGPESKILGPNEGIKVVTISAGVPKQENQAKLATINLGPDFMNDMFTVRTKDNAVLELEVTYKWRFVVDDASLYKFFEGDFIGYSCQSLRSRIREVASMNEFEKFHTSASQLMRERLFKDYKIQVKRESKTVEEEFRGRFFPEFNFLIFEMDVKRIHPVDNEIAALLDESIKSSMKILCRKLNDNAETEAEKEKIESESEIAKLQRNLIEIQSANYSKEVLEKAKIEGAALIERAKAEMEAEEMLERSRMELEIESMQKTMDLLKGASGAKYIEFVKAMSLGKNVNLVTVVPSDTKSLFMPSAQVAEHSDF